MATPAFVAAGTQVNTAANVATPTTLSPTAPAGREVGNLLVLVTNSRGIGASAATPSGWNTVTGFPVTSGTASGGKIYIFTRIADGTTADNASFAWSSLTTGTSGDSASARILAFRNTRETRDAIAGTPTDQAATTTFDIPAITTAANDALIIGLAMRVHDTAHTFTISTYTERFDGHTTSGTGHGTFVADIVKGTAGTQAAQAVTPSNTTSMRVLATAVSFQSQNDPLFTLGAYRFEADGTETGSTQLGTETAAYARTLNGSDNLLLRIRLQETNDGPGIFSDDYKLQYAVNGGAWTDTGTGAVTNFASANLTDGGATTNRLTAGTGSFVAGEISETGTVTDLRITASNYTNLLYAITLQSGSLSNGDAITFRVLRNNATTGMTYSQTPTINVTKITPAYSLAAFRFYEDGTDSASTAIDTQDTNITRLVTSDSAIQVRVRIQETAGGLGASTDDYVLQYRVNSGSWTDTGTGAVVNFNSANLLSGNSVTSERLTGGTGSNNTGRIAEFGNVSDLFIGPSNYSEQLYSVQLVAASTSAADVIQFRITRNGTAITSTVTPQVTVSKGATFSLTQSNYMFYADGAEGTSQPYSPLTNIAPKVDLLTSSINMGLRVRLQETGGVAGAATDDYKLQYKINAGAWTDTGTGGVTNFASSNLTDGGSITVARLGTGSGSFVNGLVSEDGTADNLQITASNYTELLYSITLNQASFADGDTLTFQVLKNNATTDMTYTNVPTINISKNSNWVNNTGFETNTNGWQQTAVGWDTSTIATSAAQAKAGTNSMLVTFPTSSSGESGTLYGIICKADTTYELDAWVYVPTGEPDIKPVVYGYLNGTTITAKNTWTQVIFRFAHVGAEARRFFGFSNASAYVNGDIFYLDEAYVREVIPKTGTDSTEITGTDYSNNRWGTDSTELTVTESGSVDTGEVSKTGTDSTELTGTEASAINRPNVRSYSVANTGSGTSSTLTIDYPSDIQNGDVAYLHVAYNVNTAVNTPARWTRVYELDSGSFGQEVLFRRRLGSDLAGTTLNSSIGDVGRYTAIMVVVDNDNGIDVDEEVYSGVDTTTGTIPPITPTYNNALMLAFIRGQIAAPSQLTMSTTSTTWRELTETTTSHASGANLNTAAFARDRWGGAGVATGTVSPSFSSTSNMESTIAIAIRPVYTDPYFITGSDSTEVTVTESGTMGSEAITGSDSTVITINESTSLSTGAEQGPYEEEETFESATTSQTVGGGSDNTIFDSNVVSGSSTATVVASGALHGSKMAEFNSVSAASTARINFPSLQSLVYVRAYMKFSSFGVGGNTSVITFYDTTSGTTVRASVQIMSDTPTNGLRIRNGTTAVDTSTTSFSDNTWYRLEYMIDDANNTQELRIWGGSTIESSNTADCIEILTGAYTQATSTTGRVSIGPIATAGETVLTSVDSVAWGNTDWIGPLATGGPILVTASDSTVISSTDSGSAQEVTDTVSKTGTDSTEITGSDSSSLVVIALITGSDSTAISSSETSYIGPDTGAETFEGGTNNATVSESNTDFEIVSGTGAYTFDSANAKHGSLAGEIDATAGSIRGKFRTLGRRKKLYVSGYFKFAGFTENSKFLELETLETTDNGVANLWLKTTGKIEFRDGLDATGTLTTTTLSADTWYRIDVRYDYDLAEIELRIYTGTNIESTGTAYTETLTITKDELTNTHVERIMVGRALTNTSLMYVDSLAYSDQDWPAPRGAEIVAKTGTDSTEITGTDASTRFEKTTSDTTQITVTETSSGYITASGTDSTDITGTDASTRFEKTTSDSTLITGTDATSSLIVALSGTDSTQISSSETSFSSYINKSTSDSTEFGGGGLTFTDDFNRADTTDLGSNWLNNAAGFSIVSNKADAETNVTNFAWYGTQTLTNNNYSQGLVGGISLNNNYIACRSDGVEGNYDAYVARLYNNIPYIAKIVNGVATALGSDWGAMVSGATVKIEAIGSTITAYYNGSQAQQVTDTSITTGKYVGFVGDTNIFTVDDWVGGDTGGGAGNIETSAITVSLTGSDSTVVTGTDSGSGYITATGSDTTQIIATETSSGYVTATGSDSTQLTVTESGLVYLDNPGSDATQLTVTESGSVVVSGDILITGTDTTEITFTETSSGYVTATGSDSTVITSTETSSGYVTASGSDSTVITVTETSSGYITTTGSDSTEFTVTETSSGYITTSSADSTQFTVTETSSGYITANGTDSTEISVTEAASGYVTATGTDSTLVSITDNGLVYLDSPGSDATEITATESGSVSVSGDIPKSGTDTTEITVTETSSGYVTATGSDTTVVTGTETSSGYVTASGSDTTVVTSAETSSGYITATGSDTTEITGTDTSSGYVTTSGSDSTQITGTETSSGYITATSADTTQITSTETYELFITITGADSTAITSTETSSFGSTPISGSDSTQFIGGALTYSDNFNRTDASTLGSNWTETAGGWGITTNQADALNANDVVAWYTGTVGTSNDNWAEIVWIAGTSTAAIARGDGDAIGSDSGYLATATANGYRLQKRVNGSGTNLGTEYSVTKVSGDIVRVEVQGSTVTLKVNGVQRDQVTDTSITTGVYTGMWSTTSTNRFDNFAGGEFGGGSVETSSLLVMVSTNDTTNITSTESVSFGTIAATGSDSTQITGTDIGSKYVEGTVETTGSDTTEISSSETASYSISLNRADSTEITVTETTSGYITATGSDTTQITSTETVSFAQIDAAGSDSTQITGTEAYALFVSLTGADSTEISSSETTSIVITGTATVTGSDSTEITGAESASLYVTLTGTDSTDITATETTAGYITATGTDTTEITVTETSDFGTYQKAGTDSTEISSSETTDIVVAGTLTKSASDTTEISVTESNQITAGITGTDSTDISSSETSSIIVTGTVTKSGSDTTDISSTDTGSLAINLAGSDSTEISSSESVAFGTIAFTASDTTQISAAESVSFATIEAAGTDSTQIGSTDNGLIFTDVASSDATEIQSADSSSIIITGQVNISGSDSTEITATESTSFGYYVIGPDSTEISSSESSILNRYITTNDNTQISSTESISFATVPVSGTDSTVISSSETGLRVIWINGTDSTAISSTDATVPVNAVTVSALRIEVATGPGPIDAITNMDGPDKIRAEGSTGGGVQAW